jgi:hypothetical protein
MLGWVKLVAWGGMGSEVWDFHFLKGFVGEEVLTIHRGWGGQTKSFLYNLKSYILQRLLHLVVMKPIEMPWLWGNTSRVFVDQG